MKTKRAQAALEYLFTYGWAFFVILLAIGALLYFGMFDFDRLRGSDCVFPAGALCEEFYVGPGIGDSPNAHEARLILRNTYGVVVNLDQVSISSRLSGDAPCAIVGAGAYPHTWNRDTTIELYCALDSSSYVRGQRYDITFTGDFTQQGHPYVHTLIGWVSTNAQ